MVLSKKKDKITFEEAFKGLEEVVNQLESGNLSLDESLKYFEEGISFLRTCRGRLQDAESKIEILISQEDGEFCQKPFDGDVIKEEQE